MTRNVYGQARQFSGNNDWIEWQCGCVNCETGFTKFVKTRNQSGERAQRMSAWCEHTEAWCERMTIRIGRVNSHERSEYADSSNDVQS